MVAGASSATAAQAAARAAVAAPAFRDIGESGIHQPSVEALAGLGVLNGTGCDPERLCPRDPLPRWEMAVWVVRVRQLPGLGQVSGSRFTDVDAHLWWARHVEVLAQSAITTGCATRPLRFCPEQRVTRAEMASFLMRTFDLDPAPEAGFVDVERGVHAAAIDALRASGITAGCGTGPLRYCPGDSVTRAEMASFLARAMGIVELPRNSDSRALEPLSDQTLSKVGDAARMIRERRSDTLRLNSQGAPDCPPQAAPTGVPDEVEVLRVVDGCMRVAYERLNGRTLDEFRLRIAGDPTVLTVDRPVTVEFSQSPGGDDPRSGEQWFLDAVDARALWAGWPAGAEVKVAVIDTGVDGTHQDLVSSLLPGKGRVPGSDDPDDGRVDPDGHGTHVAGIVAAEAQNGLNGAGVAPRAKVVPIKIDLLGAPSEIDSYDVVRYASGALSDAVNLRSDVINMSWGSYRSSATLRAALRVAHELGIVAVASAGNDAEDASGHYPSGYDTVIAVAAASARQDGSLADFSNYGGGVVVAPGETILSTAPGNQMTYARGTSMAAPIVSAVAAHIKARWPGADPDEIRDAIEQTALLRPGERADRLGHGHIQPLAAIAYLSELLGPPAEPPPGPPSGPPSAPGAQLLTPGDSRIGVTWTPPDDNGDAITWYEIVAESTNEWSNTFAPGNTRSATITGLTNNIAYGVQVRAWNSQGPGEWSPGSVATPEPDALPPEAPDAPLLTPGDSRIGVTWTPPDDNGDAITWYEIVAESTNEWSNTFAPGNTRSATITGLTNNIAYGVQVRAWNSQGPGEWSPGSVATPEPDALPPEAPDAPLLTPGDSRIGVTWTPPDDNGDAITWYEIVAESTNEWSNTFAPGNTRSATITGLTNNIAYGVQVRAWNSQGPGEWSPGSVATPRAPAGVRELRISWGSRADDRADCPLGTECRNLSYTYVGDWPSPPYTVECFDRGVRTASFQWSGRAETGCYYWGGVAQVVVDGVRSNELAWQRTTKPDPPRAVAVTSARGDANSRG